MTIIKERNCKKYSLKTSRIVNVEFAFTNIYIYLLFNFDKLKKKKIPHYRKISKSNLKIVEIGNIDNPKTDHLRFLVVFMLLDL
jgi:hypothetical protein